MHDGSVPCVVQREVRKQVAHRDVLVGGKGQLLVYSIINILREATLILDKKLYET